MKGWFSTSELVIIVALAAVAGVTQALWPYLVLQVRMLGPFTEFFWSIGFIIWAFLALSFVPKPGAATLVKGLGGAIEVFLGLGFAPITIYTGIVEGLGVDIAYLVFRRRLSIEMMIIGALLAPFIALPVDLFRNDVPLNYGSIVAYLSPGMVGKVFSAAVSYGIIKILRGEVSPAQSTEQARLDG
jgi:energy-coupling factor transport system substrate-specific component